MSDEGISPILATIILIAIAVIAGIVVYMFTSGTLATMSDPVNISPTIYSSHDNIGVLNENAVFNITIHNPLKENLQVKTQITADGNSVFNDTRTVTSLYTDNEVVAQKLSYTGLWVVRVSSQDPNIGQSYSFTTVTNDKDADIQINALTTTENNQNYAIYALVIAIAGLISSTAISCLAYFRPREKKEPDG